MPEDPPSMTREQFLAMRDQRVGLLPVERTVDPLAELIITVVAECCHVDREQIVNKKYNRDGARARRLAIYFVVKHTKLSARQIASLFEFREVRPVEKSAEIVLSDSSLADDVARISDCLKERLKDEEVAAPAACPENRGRHPVEGEEAAS